MRRVRLTYLDHMIRQPVIYQMGKDFEVITNIRRADIQENIAWVILELEGDEIEIDNALEWVRTLGVRVDPALGDLVEG
ncbi:MAG: FeS-binding protein [Dehalococcoidia bacterium]|nr:FeS-binding protein [Dehalococcoidia bacterium]